MKPGEWVRVASLFSIIELALVTSYFRPPHFIFGGIVFMDGFLALVMASALSLGFLAVSVFMLKRIRKSYAFARSLSLIMSANSLANLAASAVVFDDISGFLTRVIGDGAVYGFIFTECLVAICSISLFWMIGRSRKALE